MPTRYLPSAVAKAYREEHPGLFEGVGDKDLLDAIKLEDPDTWGMVDETLLGEELLSRPTARPAGRPTITPPPLGPSGLETTISTGLRVVPGVAGSFFGPVGGAVGSGAGEIAGQLFERGVGLRDEFTPAVVASEAAIGAVPGATLRRLGKAGQVLGAAGTGAGLSTASLTGRTLLEEGRLPTGREAGTAAALGTGFGAGVGGAAVAGRAIAGRAPSFGDATGALPIDVGAPPPARPAEMLPMARAAAQVYEAEESRLASELVKLYPSATRPSTSGDYHTALQAKDYLEQMASLRQTPVPVPEMLAPDEIALTLRGQPSQPLLAERAGPGTPPPGPIRAFPPGDTRPVELVGSGAPPSGRVIGGTDVGAVQPPPTFEQALEASLQAPPGDPRLVRPLVLSSPDVPRGTAQQELLPPPQQSFDQPIRQGARVGGKKPTEAQPRLKGVLEPGVDRPYATGPNAGPRRAPRQEPHGAPRTYRRQVRTGKKVSYETVESPMIAEDPGTYPPAVRREIAAMAWELDQYRHERVPGGVTRGMMDEFEGDIAEIRRRGASAGGAIPGAPVYHDILEAAQGTYPHTTRAKMLQQLRGALLEGKGTGLTDAAAQVARARLAQRQSGAVKGKHTILSQRGDEGDAIIGWVDEAGNRALADQDLDPFQQSVREAEDGEILSALRIADEGYLNEATEPYFQAAREEAVRRGLIPPEQPGLTMEGPGGAGGPRLFDYEGETQAARNQRAQQEILEGKPAIIGTAPPPRPGRTGMEEFEPVLPGTEGVREQNIPTPEIAEAPFALTPPPAKPAISPRQPSLLENLLREEGVLVLDVPAGDRNGLKRWLRRQEGEHGGETWFNRVEQAIEDGEWDRAWKTAASASVRSYAASLQSAKTPAQRAQIEGAIRGTPLQSDLNTQIIAQARRRAGVGTAPPVKDFPPSKAVSQAGAARGRATLGPAGILSPGPPQRPLSSAAPALRGGTLDKNVVKLILEATAAEGKATIPGNQDTMDRLFRQIGEDVYLGKNLRLLREAGVKIPPEELAQHFNNTVSDWGRGLNLLKQFADANKATLEEAAEAMSMGGALRGMLGRGEPPPPRVGAGGRVIGKTAQEATIEVIAKDSAVYQQNMVANVLQKRKPVGVLRALHDASYPWMLMRWSTAVRDYISTTGRYSVDSLDHALTIPVAALTGDLPTAQLSRHLLQERGLAMAQRGASVTPRRAWQEDLQGIFDLTADTLKAAKPNDVRLALKVLQDIPEGAAQFLGTVGGEDLRVATADVPVLRHLTNPRVQRIISMFRRAQEFSGRAVVFDGTLRALLRARGHDPTTLLRRPTAEIAAAVGGQNALEDLIFTSTAQSLEATFAGQVAKDSLPGALIRFINQAWPLKLGVPFPRFNFSSAPRWIYDHGPWALAELVRFPLDVAGLTAPAGTSAGGRLYRGVRAQKIERETLPGLVDKMGQQERRQGTALAELLATQREWQTRSRQVKRLQQRPQTGLPGTQTALQNALEARDQLARRREVLKSDMQDARTAVGDLKAEQKKLLDVLMDARGINAPNFAQYMARIGTGTVGMLGAAWVVRSQEGAQGTRWYEFRVEREGQDPIILDFRPFAPFAQYLFVADVLQDFYTHTDWDAYQTQTETEGGDPLTASRALWNNYEGKYTGQELGAQFAQAFLSISRAAGTTLTITDLMTQNGWPGPQQAVDAIIGTIGQFLGRWTVGAQQIKDIAGQFDPEEAKIRMPPRATLEEMGRPLGAPIGNLPYASRVIPERISQTTGKPVASEFPLLRALAGIGTAPRDFVVEEVRRIGVPGQSVYIRETGDYGLDRLIAETYARILEEELPNVLEDPSYTELGTPARQRDFMQRYIFPALKRAAIGETKDLLGEGRVTEATVRGEEARRRDRQTRMLDSLEAEEPALEEDLIGAPPPGPPATGGGATVPPPPPSPF